MKSKAIQMLLLGLTCMFVVAAAIALQHDAKQADVDCTKLAEQVRAEFLHAWQGYKQYAWGHDDLQPLSKTYHDWYDEPLLMSPVDALDTMILMGLDDEATKTKTYIVENLIFNKDIFVKNFEITIRILGGLLSSYQLSGDQRLLTLAEELGNKLLPAFNSPTGIPYMFVNLKTGEVRHAVTNPAEAGTLLLEFGTLGKLIGKPLFYEKAKRALTEVFKRRSAIGLVGQRINAETGEWTLTDSSISAEIDSYYEYLLKCGLLFGDEDCKHMWVESIAAVNQYLADDTGTELWYGHADMTSGRRTATVYGALDAFFPALLALSGDLKRATRLQESGFKMWNLHGIEPEELDYRSMKVQDPSYYLRPEIIESTYYLYHYSKDPKYLRMGSAMWTEFVKYCKSEAGYSVLTDVTSKEKKDAMPSFLFAETFKYFYLLFAPPRALPFDQVIFNTEAHPLKKTQ